MRDLHVSHRFCYNIFNLSFFARAKCLIASSLITWCPRGVTLSSEQAQVTEILKFMKPVNKLQLKRDICHEN